jgi:hypothetical protein
LHLAYVCPSDFETLDIIHRTNQLFQSVLRLGIKLLPRDNPDLCETILKIFTPTSHFYLKHTDPEMQLDVGLYSNINFFFSARVSEKIFERNKSNLSDI